MYTIKQAAARTGLRIPTVRAWERRYGVVQPSRTSAGYRLYDETSIARLVAMRYLVEVDGWRPSQAAARVLAAGTDLTALGGGAPSTELTGPATASEASRSGSSVASVQAFVTAAHRLDVPTMQRILDEGFAAQRFELAMDRIVFPALRTIGDAWSTGEIDVAVEHAASETVRRRLAQFFDATGHGERIPKVIVGLPPGSHHEIGAFAFAVAGRRVGLDVLYLGANVPVESWLRTVRETSAPAVVLAVVTSSDAAGTTAVITALRAMSRPPRCLLGGASAHDIPESIGATLLPEPLDDAVATVVDVVDHAIRRAV